MNWCKYDIFINKHTSNIYQQQEEREKYFNLKARRIAKEKNACSWNTPRVCTGHICSLTTCFCFKRSSTLTDQVMLQG